MNKVFQSLKFPAFLLLIIVTIIACEQDYNSIESDLLPEKNFKTDFFEAPIVSSKNADTIQLSGVWNIDRKDFGIVWSRVLDKGGVIVGNIITVEWNINETIPRS